ncbi:MAG: hypothetical protein NTX00_03595 [Candidatus Parcubacteria bacterium]|nr:hypothetical protein [Candidatus Parcubacteria bacterium]
MNQRGKVLIGLFCFLVIIIFTSQIFTSEVFASWKNMDRTAIFENISNNSADSYVPQLQIAANNIPYIVWSDNSTGNGDIYFKKWTPSVGWTKMNGDTGFDNLSNNSGASTVPQIKLNSENIPYIIWQDSNDVFFTRWTVGAGPTVCGTGIDDCWTKMDGTLGQDNISNTSGNSEFIQLAIDHQDNPYIIWRETISGNKEIYFSKWTPGVGWTKMDGTLGSENFSNNVGNSDMPQIQVDSNNNPYVAWNDNALSTGDIDIIKWTPGVGWTKMDGVTSGYENVSSNTYVSNEVKLQLDTNDNPCLVWTNGLYITSEIYFTRWKLGIGWSKMNGSLGFDNVSDNSGYSFEPQIKLDKANNPYILWDDETTDDRDVYFSKWTPNVGWTKMNGDSGSDNLSNNSGLSQSPQLILDSADRPFAYWYDDTNTSFIHYELYLTKWTASVGWTKMDGVNAGYEIISNNAVITGFAQMQLDNMNFPYMLWQNDNSGNFEVYFTRWLLEEQGQVNISASVDPSLTLSLPSATCDLGTFSSSTLKTCYNSMSISTNASSGYLAYIRADGDLRNAINHINNISGGSITEGTEGYGVSTTQDSQDIAQINDANNDTFYTSDDCTTMNGNTIAANASAITTSDQQFASANGPVSNDETSLCLAVAISGNTPAGSYSQILNLTVVANF